MSQLNLPDTDLPDRLMDSATGIVLLCKTYRILQYN